MLFNTFQRRMIFNFLKYISRDKEIRINSTKVLYFSEVCTQVIQLQMIQYWKRIDQKMHNAFILTLKPLRAKKLTIRAAFEQVSGFSLRKIPSGNQTRKTTALEKRPLFDAVANNANNIAGRLRHATIEYQTAARCSTAARDAIADTFCFYSKAG